jgi:hypothetical protein
LYLIQDKNIKKTFLPTFFGGEVILFVFEQKINYFIVMLIVAGIVLCSMTAATFIEGLSTEELPCPLQGVSI